MISVQETVASCLDVRRPFSIKRHVLGVLAQHRVAVISDGVVVSVPYTQVRSLKQRIRLMRTRPFVRVAIVDVRPLGSDEGATNAMQEDLDTANAIYEEQCQAWIYFTHFVVYTDRFGTNVTVETASGDATSDVEALLDIGKSIEAPVIGYFVGRLTSAAGQASSKLRAFWLGRTPFGQARRYIFTHELGHVVGSLDHLEDQQCVEDPSNLMCVRPAWGQGPTINQDQCSAIRSDQDMHICGGARRV